jgi:hypothetical protein
MDQLAERLDVEALHARLCQRIAELHPLFVADVTSVFLEISSLPCEESLWSLEFAFDEDDGRVARIEARFMERSAGDPFREAHRGYEVELLLPRVRPTRASADGERAAAHVLAMAAEDGSLGSRFLRALADLGAYRTIEALEVLSAEANLI